VLYNVFNYSLNKNEGKLRVRKKAVNSKNIYKNNQLLYTYFITYFIEYKKSSASFLKYRIIEMVNIFDLFVNSVKLTRYNIVYKISIAQN
jgi:hypothetical protein